MCEVYGFQLYRYQLAYNLYYFSDASDGYSITSGDSRRPSAGPSTLSKRPTNLAGASAKDPDRLEGEGLNEIREASSTSLAARSGSRMYQLLTTGDNESLPALTPSLFSRVPPTINFVSQNQKGMNCICVIKGRYCID